MTLEEIKATLESGDVMSAMEELKELLAAHPDDLEAKLLYGTCCHICGDDDTFIKIDDEVAKNQDMNHRRIYRKYHALRVAACGALAVALAAMTVSPAIAEAQPVYGMTPAYGVYCLNYVARINFHGGGGSGSMPSVRLSGNTCNENAYVLPSCEFVRHGYEFVGWLYNGYRLYDPGEPFYLYEGEFNFTAQWELIARDYTLTVNSNGGYFSGGNFGGMNGQSGTAALTVTTGSSRYCSLGRATRSGYAFAGWWTSRTGGMQVFDANGDCVVGGFWNSARQWDYKGDITLYARWNEHGAVSVSSADVIAGKTLRLVFHRTDGDVGAIAVKVKTQSSTGICGTDFAYVKDVLVWEHGDASDKVVEIPTYASGAGKQLRVKLAPLTTGAYAGYYTPVIAEPKAYFPMETPDPGVVYAAGASSLSVSAGDTLRVRFRRAWGSDGAIAVKVKTQTSTGICGTDFKYVNTVLRWEDGDTSDRYVDIPTYLGAWDGTRLLRIKLSTLTTGAYAGNLAPTLDQSKIYAEIVAPYSYGTVSVEAGNSCLAGEPLLLVFRRSEGTDGAIAVKYKVQTSTAIAGTDFEYQKGVVAWADGENDEKFVEVPTYPSAARKQLRVKLATLTQGDYTGCVTPHLYSEKVYVSLW